MRPVPHVAAGLSLLLAAACGGSGEPAGTPGIAGTAGASFEGAPSGGSGSTSGPTVSAARAFVVDVEEGVVYGRALRRSGEEPGRWVPVDLTLDVYRPRGARGPRPVLVCVHGGGFAGSITAPARSVEYSLGELMPFVSHFAMRGFVVFVPRYRLQQDRGAVPPGFPPPPDGFDPGWYGAMYPAVCDIKEALRFVHAEAATYGLDEDCIALLGGSAGAAISISLGVCDPEDFADVTPEGGPPAPPSLHPGARSDVRSVVAMWGNHVPVDALRRYDGRDRFDAGDAAMAIIHGREDDVSPFAHGILVREKLAAAGIPHVFLPFDGGHADWEATIEGEGLPEVAFDFVVEAQRLELR